MRKGTRKKRNMPMIVRSLIEEDLLKCENYAMMLDTYAHVHNNAEVKRCNDLLDRSEEDLIKNIIDMLRVEYSNGYINGKNSK